MSIEQFMMRAVELSRESMDQGGGPFGAVVVDGGRIIGEGMNSVVPLLDPTAHAEVMAIRDACRNKGDHDLSGALVFSSSEPCPMCMAAIWWARIDTVYYANSRKDAALIGFDDAALYEELMLPIPQRTLPLVQMGREEAIKVFEEWASDPEKMMY